MTIAQKVRLIFLRPTSSSLAGFEAEPKSRWVTIGRSSSAGRLKIEWNRRCWKVLLYWGERHRGRSGFTDILWDNLVAGTVGVGF